MKAGEPQALPASLAEETGGRGWGAGALGRGSGQVALAWRARFGFTGASPDGACSGS